MRLIKIQKVIFLNIIFLWTLSTSASTSMLFYHSEHTYVSSYHPDNYFADEYVGTASVRGTDRVVRNQETYGFAWTRITYDVQGEVSSKTAISGSNTDNVTRKVTLTVYDKWNFGTKTKAYYSVGYRWYSSNF